MKTEDVFAYMKRCIGKKREQGKESTADLYRASCNRLKSFRGSKTLQWKEITEEFVDRFEAYLKTEKLKTNSRNSYLSNVRAMYNAAVRDKMVSPFPNPFSHLKLKREQTEKRALPRNIIERIAGLNPGDRPELRQAIDFYMFCYLSCGMPFIDLAFLTQDNISGDRIVYNRIKTGVKVSIPITPGMKALLTRYHREGALRLFPILPDKEEISHEVYKSRLHHENKCLKEAGKTLGLKTALTIYVARHSWASQAQEQDIPIAVIKQNLGHTSEDTTRIYLAALSQEKIKEESVKVTKEVDRIVCGHT